MKNITFIYAGAGSGKTHKLTSLLTDFIQNDLVSASQVMLTTFTKKASNEIKERAQSELLKNKLFFLKFPLLLSFLFFLKARLILRD